MIALLALFALTVVACAAPAAPAAPAAEAPAGEAVAEAPAAEAPAESAAPAAGTVIKVGTNAEYQPFEFVDENGEIVGFDVDLVNEIAERAGFEVEWVNTKWDGIFVALANGEFDAVASSVTITDERKQTIDFSEPYFNAGQAIAVKADNTEIAGPESLTEGVRVGVQLGTTGDIWLTDNTQADVQRFDENPLAIQALAAGDLDAVVADAPTLADIIRANPELNLKMVGEPFTEELYGIGIRKGQEELKAQIDAALAEIREDGTYDEIYNKWFGAEQ
jgi:polar amino acid transport system substrate-binding protein